MTKISRKKLAGDKMSLMIEQLWRAFASLRSKDEVRAFLYDILTHTEIQMLSKRLQVVMMLEAGYTYEQIKNSLNVSEATISKIQNWKEAFGSGYGLVLERLKDGKKKRFIPTKISSKMAATRLWKF